MKLIPISRVHHYSSIPRLSFNTLKESEILLHCKSGSLSKSLQLLNTLPYKQIKLKPLLYASLLQTCTTSHSFMHGLLLHAHVLKSGLEKDRFVGNSLLSLYFKLNTNFIETRKLFDNLEYKDVISWTSMITGYIRIGKPKESLELFNEMWRFDIEPNGFTLSSVIKACSDIGSVRLGRCFHCVVLKNGFDSNCVISSALIDMYGRNYAPWDARSLFDELVEPDAVCWTSVISAFTRNDLFEEALVFFYSMMREHGLRPDGFTFGSVLTACGNLGRSKHGEEVHAKVVTSGISGKNVVVESSLVDMYGKCGLVNQSRSVFDRMARKNSVSWCALLGGYCQNGDFKCVIDLFRIMDEVEPYAFGTVLRACAGLAAVRQGKEVHCQYLRKGGWKDIIVESALVDLYAKCGHIDYALRIFVQMKVRNMISWNSMICGLAQNGKGEKALQIFDDMLYEGIKPDYITYIGVLFACCHTGFLGKGRGYFRSMTEEHGIKPGVEHYNCMVDLLGRAGLLDEAENLLRNSDCKDDSSIWAVLLGACTTGTDLATAERIAKKMMDLKPEYHLSYVYLANVYKAVGRWNDAVKIRDLMKDTGAKKTAGTSWIETNNLESYMDGSCTSKSKRINFQLLTTSLQLKHARRDLSEDS